MTTGVMRVKIADDNIPNPRVYFPPNFSDKMPPGMWVMTLKKKNQLIKIKSKLFHPLT